MSDLAGSGLTLVTLGSGFVRHFTVLFCPKDLMHTTKCQSALLSEQAQLQKDVSQWTARLESCQKETETKEQQLQELRDEIRESKLQLDQQEMVLYSKGVTIHFVGLCLPPPYPRPGCPMCTV